MTHDEMIEGAWNAAEELETRWKKQLGAAEMLQHLKNEGYVIYKPEPEQPEEDSA